MLSVIIGTLDNERTLVRTLSALVPAAATGVVREVIVADGGSKDATLEVADIAGCDVTSGSSDMRFAKAVEKAKSDWLMFLRPGAIPDPGWSEEVTQFLERVPVHGDSSPAATFRRSTLFAPRRSALGEAFSILLSGLFRRIDPDQGLIIAKRHYDSVGGHSSSTDPEAELLRRVRSRLVVLRSGMAVSGDT